MTHETSRSWKRARKRDDLFAAMFADRSYKTISKEKQMKHSPAPWRVEADGIKVGPENAFKPFGGCGCCGSPYMMASDDAMQIADAKLIAAAPDLLEALQKLLREAGRNFHDWPVMDDARAAIAKATGQ